MEEGLRKGDGVGSSVAPSSRRALPLFLDRRSSPSTLCAPRPAPAPWFLLFALYTGVRGVFVCRAIDHIFSRGIINLHAHGRSPPRTYVPAGVRTRDRGNEYVCATARRGCARRPVASRINFRCLSTNDAPQGDRYGRRSPRASAVDLLSSRGGGDDASFDRCLILYAPWDRAL